MAKQHPKSNECQVTDIQRTKIHRGVFCPFFYAQMSSLHIQNPLISNYHIIKMLKYTMKNGEVVIFMWMFASSTNCW